MSVTSWGIFAPPQIVTSRYNVMLKACKTYAVHPCRPSIYRGRSDSLPGMPVPVSMPLGVPMPSRIDPDFPAPFTARPGGLRLRANLFTFQSGNRNAFPCSNYRRNSPKSPVILSSIDSNKTKYFISRYGVRTYDEKKLSTM